MLGEPARQLITATEPGLVICAEVHHRKRACVARVVFDAPMWS
jgi:hypothetical protein